MCEKAENASVKCNFTLNAEDLMTAYKVAQIIKSDRRKYVYMAILGACGAVNAVSYFSSDDKNLFFLFLAVVCFAFVAVLWFVPGYFIKKSATESVSGKEIEAQFFESYVSLVCEGEQKCINFSDVKYINNEQLFVFTNGGNDVTVIPKRVLDEGDITKIEEILTNSEATKD